MNIVMSPFEDASAEEPEAPEAAWPGSTSAGDGSAVSFQEGAAPPTAADAPEDSFEEREITVSAEAGSSTPARRIRIRYFIPHLRGWTGKKTKQKTVVGAPVRKLSIPMPSWARAAVLSVVWLMVLGATLTMSGGDGNEDLMAMPDEFIGVWRTVAPKYADTFFEISPRQLRLGTGGEAHAVHDIARLTRVFDRSGLIYTVWYVMEEDDTTPHPLSFYYDREGRVLRLKNQQDIVWSNLGPPPAVNDLVRDIEESSTRYQDQYGERTGGRRDQEDDR